MPRIPVLTVALGVMACTPKPSALERASQEPDAVTESPATPEAAGSGPTAAPPPITIHTDARVSTSRGQAGGVVVLWPRVVPASQVKGSAALAGNVQAHVQGLVERALPGRAVDVRPAPQRTCPRAGCEAVAVGVLVVRSGKACAAVAFVMPPGTTEPTTLVAWTGRLSLKSTRIGFREPPESSVTIHDFALCKDLPAALDAGSENVAEALKAAAG